MYRAYGDLVVGELIHENREVWESQSEQLAGQG